MAITSLDGFIAATKQIITYSRTATRTTVANVWFAVHDLAGNPGAATLAVGNTANGLVPTDATAGFPKITFSSGLGYVAAVQFGCSVAGRFALYDRVFHAGAYAFNANTTLTSQPSYSGRAPNSDYSGLQIWAEAVTAGTGTQSVTVTYTDQDGNTGATTGAVSAGATMTVGKMWQLPLAAGDSGVQVIESVVGSVASAGTFNIVVVRPLWTGRVVVANDADSHGFDRTGLPQIFGDSALAFMVAMDSTSTGLPDHLITVASG